MHMQLMMRLQLLEHAARRLNRQERDVAEKIMEGKLNRQIARELDISDRTVERRRAAILKHLNAATTPEVVSQLVERELLRRWLRASSDLQWQSARNAHLALAAVAL
jgi:DNA-binding NarL/FixJ family response regulator